MHSTVPEDSQRSERRCQWSPARVRRPLWLRRRRIRLRYGRLVRLKLRLGLGCRWTLPRRRRRLSRGLRGLRSLPSRRILSCRFAVALPETPAAHSQHCDYNRCSLHAFSSTSHILISNPLSNFSTVHSIAVTQGIDRVPLKADGSDLIALLRLRRRLVRLLQSALSGRLYLWQF